MWGGAGRVCAHTDAACLADPGATGEYIDHLAGGKDEDVIDWRPRGAYGTAPTFVGRTCSTSTLPVTTKKDGTNDPCSWFEMTDRSDDVASTPATLANNQHHQGVDWVYGGWDRDVMQGDLSENGPHPGDRLMDWSGVYNLYSHCNAAYGGYTDVRIPAPAVEAFLRAWATGQRRRSPGRCRHHAGCRDGRDLGVRRAGAGLQRRQQGPRDRQRLPDDSGPLRRRQRLRGVLSRRS